ncbi:MAG: hypothetical protein ACTSRG_27440 [Candidatus Helarchaeota archaeon]
MLEIFCPFPEISEKMWFGVNLTDDECWRVINNVSDPLNWDKMSYNFTKLILDMIPDEILLDHQPIQNSIFSKRFREDSQFKSEIMEKILERKMQKIKNKKIKRKKSLGEKFQKVNDYKEKFSGENSLSYGFASFESIDFLDNLYQYHIKQLELKLPDKKEMDHLPIGYLNRQIMTDQDNPLEFDPMMVYFLPRSDNLLLYKKNQPITTNNFGAIRKRGFPNLVVFCDDSGSMNWDPFTCSGKYDAVLITIYSIFNWLKNNPFAASIQYNFTLFSNTTRSSGWLDYYHLNEILPLIFNPELGGTKLNISQFCEILNNPKEKAVIFITDGEITNREKIKFELIKNRHNIDFLFIQIGKKSELAKELENSGFQIIEIENILNLSKIIMNFVKKTYQY